MGPLAVEGGLNKRGFKFIPESSVNNPETCCIAYGTRQLRHDNLAIKRVLYCIFELQYCARPIRMQTSTNKGCGA